jgi:hypothetical protein
MHTAGSTTTTTTTTNTTNTTNTINTTNTTNTTNAATATIYPVTLPRELQNSTASGNTTSARQKCQGALRTTDE